MSNGALWKNRIGFFMTLFCAGLCLCACETNNGSQVYAPLKTGEVGEEVIKTGGKYYLSGDIKNTVKVDAPGEEVTIVLDNAYIQPVSGSAISISNAESVAIVAAEGSENTLKDAPHKGKGSSDKGCIYSKCDLLITGSGILNIYGYYQDAIRCKDRMSIIDANIVVTSKKDGIRANDGVIIENSAVSVQSEKNGILTTKVGKNNKGLVSIYDSNVDIIAGAYGIVAQSDLEVSGSKLFNNSVLGKYNVEGSVSMEEGCEVNE